MKTEADRLVGSWRLLSCEHRHADGRVTRPFGAGPRGRLVYRPDGRMMVMLGRRRPRAFASRQLFEARDAELAEAARGFVAYTGRWSVRSGNVVHRVEQSLFPNWIGTRQARKVRLAGRRLELSTVPFEVDGDRQTAHLVWEREALR